ncbi:hypothetical protein EDC96DRAFT_544852 [Choanephora cucurbitarum]|uniref:Mimitin, mitochondrial n=1 Tax=Choanephora cucurbitarum TaxID=101091 RepID=A0A1C7NAT5_9FUNG|nr:hypothetical protein EDC96DRAFT_549952 [Choanephora cucurbitarum]KAI8364538.1 hypothetical protein EDC96DRAFT_544852 [Choanephora cucurbitarum]OBZ85829.1 Mimitin, mitochondrial [Choanephora cucurbitarum]
MSKPASLIQRLSLNYKTSRFPWKKHALIGYDLQGNEYWDCPNPLGGRMKRWVQLAEVGNNDHTVFHQNKLPVQWQAWLRHTRNTVPTMEELVLDEKRKALIQGRAKALDQEWEEKKLALQQAKEQEQLELQRQAAAIESGNKEAGSTSQPSGQGDTFTPGEWNPTSSRR